jgi:uncharacterized membrane protein
MDDKNKAIRELQEKIEEIARRQNHFQAEIQKLQNAIFELSYSSRSDATIQTPPEPFKQEPIKAAPAIIPVEVKPPVQAAPAQALPKPNQAPRKKERSPLEEFIGTNLLNKIGIAVLVVGIGFGAKYSIDHELLSPLTRIILGYVAGIALIVVAIRLKPKHENFSAVLLSGGMAVMYFLTYAAYDFYQLIPQTMTFVLMVLFTAFTVFAAIQYNQEIIGIIGLVGAYAVPFLLSDGSGRVMILFSYVSIINTGILILAFNKYWKRLYNLAFVLTWLIFGAWYSFDYHTEEHLWISLAFSTVFFLTFYITFLSYKLIRKEPLSKWDIVFMMLNSFVYYGFGYLTIEDVNNGDQYLGLFTLFTAVIHFIACVIIHKQQSQFKDIFYFVAGMVLVFLTLAVPVQLEGHWVTFVWAGEAALLFWIGRTKKFTTYEKLSYPLILLTFGSLVHDWSNTYFDNYYYTYGEVVRLPLFLNVQFLTTLLVTASLGFIVWLSRQQHHPSPFKPESLLYKALQFGAPALLLFVLYIGIFKEVETFWNQRYGLSKIRLGLPSEDSYDQYDNDLLRFRTLWLIYYSAIFAMVLSLLQAKFIKDRNLMFVCLAFNALVIFSFVTGGLFELSELRSSYLTDSNNQYYFRDIGNILIRYLGLILIIPLMAINYWYMKQPVFNDIMRQTERILFHVAVLVLLSSELVHWLDMARIENSFKLSLSILWGAYALFLIVLGLWRDWKYIRIMAIVLFGITLIKLFLYDMADMSTIAKTIVMIILGVLLLTASFLYNKYKKPVENEVQ